MTQVEIAGSTGLSPATVLQHGARELDGAGAVELAPSIRNGRRPCSSRRRPATPCWPGSPSATRDVARSHRGRAARRRRAAAPPPAREPQRRRGHGAGSSPALRPRREGGQDDGRREGRRRRDPGARRQRDRTGGLREHPARMARGRCRRGDARPTGCPCLGGQHVQPRRARRAAVRRVGRGSRTGPTSSSPTALGPAWCSAGRCSGAAPARRARSATSHRRARTDLPVRQPGCLETFIGSAALSEALAGSHGRLTLRDIIAKANDGDQGCLPRAGGCRPAPRRRARRPRQPAQPGGPRARRQLSVVGDVITDPMRRALERSAIPSAVASLRSCSPS